MKWQFNPKVLASLAACAVVFCEYPGDPIPQPQGGVALASAEGEIIPINAPYQICNSSISLDTINYRGCMLWLNFGGLLNLKVSPADAAVFTVSGVFQHDRLTVTDDNDSVRWYMMKSEIPEIRGHIQDPEWSAHPDYLVFLGSESSSNAPGSWNGYVVRTGDKSVFKFSSKGMGEEATPHVWVGGVSLARDPDTTSWYENGFVGRDTVKQYFGTDSVKVVYSLLENGLTIYFVDYSAGAPVKTALAKPAGKAGYNAESAMISPDGKWVLYNCYANPQEAAAYIQRLETGSAPILIAEPGFDPRWWSYEGHQYVIYATRGGVTSEDLVQVTDGSAGLTVRQEVDLAPNGPRHIQFRKIGEPETILNYPFKGGVSPDGFYACTGYRLAYMFKYN